MGDFQLVWNLKLFEVGPHGREMHLSPLYRAHLRASSWLEVGLPGEKDAGMEIKAVVFAHLLKM